MIERRHPTHGFAMVRAVAHGAVSACGVVVVSAGSPQCPLRTSTTKEEERSWHAAPGGGVGTAEAQWKILYTASPGYVSLLLQKKI